MLGRGHDRLPDLSLVQLAIAEQAIDVVRQAEDPCGEGHAVGIREALAEGPRASFQARRLVHGRMSL